MRDPIRELYDIEQQIAPLEARRKELRAGIEAEFDAEGVRKIEHALCTITRVAGSARVSYKAAGLDAVLPALPDNIRALIEAHRTESAGSPSLRIQWRKQ
jgi:hypothetical protein